MARTTRTALTFVLSALLAFSSIPSQAIADEAMGEEPVTVAQTMDVVSRNELTSAVEPQQTAGEGDMGLEDVSAAVPDPIETQSEAAVAQSQLPVEETLLEVQPQPDAAAQEVTDGRQVASSTVRTESEDDVTLSTQAVDDVLEVAGRVYIDKAAEVLKKVNEERAKAGVSSLTMDGDLQTAAIARSAEISLNFSHTRPDGSDCFTIEDKMSGENIAAGSTTAEGVMEQWMNSEGHRKNILRSSFKSIGIGCVVVDGMPYWTQTFGYDNASTPAHTSFAQMCQFKVGVSKSVIDFGTGFMCTPSGQRVTGGLSLTVGDKISLRPALQNAGWDYAFAMLVPTSFTWSSDDPTTASVANGTITAGPKAGTTLVKATSPGGNVWSIRVDSRDFVISSYSLNRDGCWWGAVLDPRYYAQNNPDVRSWATQNGVVDGNRLVQHFVTNGAREGRRGNTTFDPISYYNANPDLRRAFGTDWVRYYRHYCEAGQGERRTCSGVGQLRGAVTVRDGVDWAHVYDALYYAGKNIDVAASARRTLAAGTVLDDAALLQHFVNNGTKECRASKAGFDVRSYYNANADLRTAFGGTVNWTAYYRHYATNGAHEGRKCSGTNDLVGSVNVIGGTNWSAVYDRAHYAQRNPDVVHWATRKCGSTTVLDDYALLSHFVYSGRGEGRASKATFDLASYYNANADLRRAFGTSWPRYYQHYATNGQHEGRTCRGVGQLRGAATTAEGVNWVSVYDANYYAQRNSDVATWARRSFSSGSVLDDTALLSHFVNNGTREARASKQTFDVRAYRNKNADLARSFGSDWKSYYRHYALYGVNEHRLCA